MNIAASEEFASRSEDDTEHTEYRRADHRPDRSRFAVHHRSEYDQTDEDSESRVAEHEWQPSFDHVEGEQCTEQRNDRRVGDPGGDRRTRQHHHQYRRPCTDGRPEPANETRRDHHLDHDGRVSIRRMAAGPTITINNTGRMQKIVGKTILSASLAEFSSTSCRRRRRATAAC